MGIGTVTTHAVEIEVDHLDKILVRRDGNAVHLYAHHGETIDELHITWEQYVAITQARDEIRRAFGEKTNLDH